MKDGLMLKFFLTFSLLFLLLTPMMAQDSSSVVIIEEPSINYPGKPLIMSLALPGAGQYYNKSPMWKTASFLGVELGSIVAWNYFTKKAKTLRNEYWGFADSNWDLYTWYLFTENGPNGKIEHNGRQWTENDFILNILPLHHIHGIINILTCALWAKAKCEMIEKFDEKLIWERFLHGNFTLFMAVPTIYTKLCDSWIHLTTNKKQALSKIWNNFRLMVSGSSALPKQIFEKWNEITGHQLLERYGMTETGMILSNTLKGIKTPSYVGIPLPKVNVMLKNDNGEKCKEDEQGEILVKGENVFKKYWNNEQATKESFENEWFKTGDIGIIENGIYKILGRNSIDIIKSGGYKISALEIETHDHCRMLDGFQQ